MMNKSWMEKRKKNDQTCPDNIRPNKPAAHISERPHEKTQDDSSVQFSLKKNEQSSRLKDQF